MPRTADALEGLAILGTSRAGPLSFPTPGLVFPDPGGEGRFPPGYSLTLGPGGPPTSGARRLSLRDPGAELLLHYHIPAPEVSGVGGAAEEAGPGAWFVHWPPPPEELERLRAARPELVVFGNARTLFSEGRPFVVALSGLRSVVGPGAVVWAPRVALPHRLALLAYLGCDLVDATAVLDQGREGTYFDPTLGPSDAGAVRAEGLCRCPGCTSDPPSAVDHGVAALAAELALVRSAIRSGRLRELVEARLTTEPALAELLRYADADLARELEERSPAVAEGIRGYVLRESTRRPEVRRFQARLIERYRPPPSKAVLLLLPCSRTKPYRNSRSHRRFAQALEGLAGLERVHVVSVTSPLGAVPRELEDLYPARHYDIPVTGQWDEGEREAVRRVVRHLRDTGNYRHTVVHLDSEEYGFLTEDLPEAEWSLAGDRPTTAAALQGLRRAVGAALESSPGPAAGPLSVVREGLRELAAVQFGRPAAERLFEPPVRLAGRPWFQRLTDGSGGDLATWQEGRGLFQLTVGGARRLLPVHPLEVSIDPRVTLRGDLFDPGVLSADPEIRTGDAVLLVRDGTLVGVGEAARPGPLMGRLGRGLAVTVRHRAPEALGPPVPPTGT